VREDNNKTDIREIRCGNMDWIRVVQNWQALLNTVMNFQDSIKLSLYYY
jgi:hypothetical protein